MFSKKMTKVGYFLKTNNRNGLEENYPRGAAHDDEGCLPARALRKL